MRPVFTFMLTGLVVGGVSGTVLSQALTPATVRSTGDGDTFRIQDQGKGTTVRLGCIDAPEMAQKPWGPQAAARLKQLLPAGQTVQLRQIDRDRYGRLVAEVFQGNPSINLRMVREGMAVIYPQYFSGCQAAKNQYISAQQQAKQAGLGIWNPANPMRIMPWEFRRRQRS